jgi:hypothetical protein
MKTIIRINNQESANKQFFLRKLEGALQDVALHLATHASLRIDTAAADQDGHRCRITVAFRNWGTLVVEAREPLAAQAMDKALMRLRHKVRSTVRPECESSILSRTSRLICCW